MRTRFYRHVIYGDRRYWDVTLGRLNVSMWHGRPQVRLWRRAGSASVDR